MSGAAATSAERPPATPSPAENVLGSMLWPVRALFGAFGEHFVLLGQAFFWLFRRPFRLRNFIEQMDFIGVGSLPIVALVAFFSGAVAGLQGVDALARFNQERWVGVSVGLGLSRELAPVFASLMISARAGSGMATELGSMRISEQIDALTSFAVNPVQYLVTPRIVAATLMLPIMTVVFDIVGLFGAWVVAVVIKDVNVGPVYDLFRFWVDPKDFIIGLIKSVVFGLALALVACQQGFFVRVGGGAKEVGMATTRAVVAGCVSVLVLDYILTDILMILWPAGT